MAFWTARSRSQVPCRLGKKAPMQLELSRRTDLGMRTLAVLADQGSLSGAAIAESVGTTTNYLPQVLKPLIDEGFIASTSGPGGGYRLVVDLKSVTVREVLEVMEGENDDHHCVLRGAVCHGPDHCVMHSAWIAAREVFLEELGKTSVESALPGFLAHAVALDSG